MNLAVAVVKEKHKNDFNSNDNNNSDSDQNSGSNILNTIISSKKSLQNMLLYLNNIIHGKFDFLLQAGINQKNELDIEENNSKILKCLFNLDLDKSQEDELNVFSVMALIKRQDILNEEQRMLVKTSLYQGLLDNSLKSLGVIEVNSDLNLLKILFAVNN